LGINSELIICEFKGQTYQCVEVKARYQFDKMFRTAMQDVILKENLNVISKSFLLTIFPFMVFPSNMVMIKGCNSLIDIGMLAGLKPSTTYKAVKELCDKEIIYKIKHNGQTDIYVNPYLISSGVVIEKFTVDLFKNSKYCTDS
jgi:hypothetical protein